MTPAREHRVAPNTTTAKARFLIVTDLKDASKVVLWQGSA